MLFSRGFLGQGKWLGQPWSGPSDSSTTTHPKVPVGLTYEPARPPSLWDMPERNGWPGMPPVMVSTWAKKHAPVRPRDDK